MMELLNNPKLDHFYSQDTHTNQFPGGYGIKKHSAAVADNFARHFAADFEKETGLSSDTMRTLLELHDIGKGLSDQTELQHGNTKEVLHHVNRIPGMDEHLDSKTISTISAIVSHDPIGKFYSGKQKRTQSELELNEGYKEIIKHHPQMTRDQYLKIIDVFYKCDAGSYPDLKSTILTEDYAYKPEYQGKFTQLSDAFKALEHEQTPYIARLNKPEVHYYSDSNLLTRDVSEMLRSIPEHSVPHTTYYVVVDDNLKNNEAALNSLFPSEENIKQIKFISTREYNDLSPLLKAEENEFLCSITTSEKGLLDLEMPAAGQENGMVHYHLDRLVPLPGTEQAQNLKTTLDHLQKNDELTKKNSKYKQEKHYYQQCKKHIDTKFKTIKDKLITEHTPTVDISAPEDQPAFITSFNLTKVIAGDKNTKMLTNKKNTDTLNETDPAWRKHCDSLLFGLAPDSKNGPKYAFCVPQKEVPNTLKDGHYSGSKIIYNQTIKQRMTVIGEVDSHFDQDIKDPAGIPYYQVPFHAASDVELKAAVGIYRNEHKNEPGTYKLECQIFGSVNFTSPDVKQIILSSNELATAIKTHGEEKVKSFFVHNRHTLQKMSIRYEGHSENNDLTKTFLTKQGIHIPVYESEVSADTLKNLSLTDLCAHINRQDIFSKSELETIINILSKKINTSDALATAIEELHYKYDLKHNHSFQTMIEEKLKEYSVDAVKSHFTNDDGTEMSGEVFAAKNLMPILLNSEVQSIKIDGKEYTVGNIVDSLALKYINDNNDTNAMETLIHLYSDDEVSSNAALRESLMKYIKKIPADRLLYYIAIMSDPDLVDEIINTYPNEIRDKISQEYEVSIEPNNFSRITDVKLVSKIIANTDNNEIPNNILEFYKALIKLDNLSLLQHPDLDALDWGRDQFINNKAKAILSAPSYAALKEILESQST